MKCVNVHMIKSCSHYVGGHHRGKASLLVIVVNNMRTELVVQQVCACSTESRLHGEVCNTRDKTRKICISKRKASFF